MNDETDTLGNIIQSYAINKYIDSTTFLSFCGYKNPHPLEKKIHLILSHSPNQSSQIQNTTSLLNDICKVYDIVLQDLEVVLTSANKITD